MAPSFSTSGLAPIGILLIVLLALFVAAVVLGARSLLLLVVRRPGDRRRGLRLALMATGLSVLAEAWSFLLHHIPYSPHPGFSNYLLVVPLQISLCAVIFWGLAGSRRISATGRLVLAVLAIGFPMGAVRGIHRWERKQWLLAGAETWAKHVSEGEASAAGWAERARDETGDSAQVSREFANRDRLWARYSAEMARAFRWAADHPEEPLPDVPEPDWRR